MTNQLKIEKKSDLNDRQQNVYNIMAAACNRKIAEGEDNGFSSGGTHALYDGRTLKALENKGYLSYTKRYGYWIVK